MVNLKSYLDNIVVECISCDSAQACLLTKALNEIADQDSEIKQVISDNLSMLQQALAEKFEQAKVEKSISADKDCHHLARYFLMGIYGLRTFAHTHPEAKVLEQLAEQLYHDVSQ